MTRRPGSAAAFSGHRGRTVPQLPIAPGFPANASRQARLSGPKSLAAPLRQDRQTRKQGDDPCSSYWPRRCPRPCEPPYVEPSAPPSPGLGDRRGGRGRRRDADRPRRVTRDESRRGARGRTRGGVRSLANDLHVKAASERTDADIAREALHRLRNNVAIPRGCRPSCATVYITLDGTVGWMHQRAAAEHAVDIPTARQRRDKRRHDREPPGPAREGPRYC